LESEHVQCNKKSCREAAWFNPPLDRTACMSVEGWIDRIWFARGRSAARRCHECRLDPPDRRIEGAPAGSESSAIESAGRVGILA